ncbi:MAG: hypothetical protein AB7E31_02795 [Desulfitobacterium sp.]
MPRAHGRAGAATSGITLRFGDESVQWTFSPRRNLQMMLTRRGFCDESEFASPEATE